MATLSIVQGDNRFLAACAGKEKYPTEQAALTVCGLFKRGKLGHRMQRMDADQLDAYRCDYCDHFHLGH